jgi:hypothetical protein
MTTNNEASTINDAADANGGVYDSCLVAIDGMINLHADPSCAWTDVLLQIPLTDRSFISGSAATWMAEHSMMRSEPIWSPNDIDVFVCLPTNDFEVLVAAFMNIHIDADCKIRRIGLQHIINVTIPGYSAAMSFIRCPAAATSQDIVQQFDIDVCTPIVTHKDGKLWVRMTTDVAASIRERKMHCNMRKRHSKFMHYPLQRTLHRVGKYVARGYFFASMTFYSSTHLDFPEHDTNCTLNISDFTQPPPPPDEKDVGH